MTASFHKPSFAIDIYVNPAVRCAGINACGMYWAAATVTGSVTSGQGTATISCAYAGDEHPSQTTGGTQASMRCLYDLPPSATMTFTQTTGGYFGGTFDNWTNVCSGSTTCTLVLPGTINGAPLGTLTILGAVFDSQ